MLVLVSLWVTDCSAFFGDTDFIEVVCFQCQWVCLLRIELDCHCHCRRFVPWAKEVNKGVCHCDWVFVWLTVWVKPLSVSFCIAVHSVWSEFDTFIWSVSLNFEWNCLSVGLSVRCVIQCPSRLCLLGSSSPVSQSVRWSILVSISGCVCLDLSSCHFGCAVVPLVPIKSSVCLSSSLVSLVVRWFIWCPILPVSVWFKLCLFGFAVSALVSFSSVCLLLKWCPRLAVLNPIPFALTLQDLVLSVWRRVVPCVWNLWSPTKSGAIQIPAVAGLRSIFIASTSLLIHFQERIRATTGVWSPFAPTAEFRFGLIIIALLSPVKFGTILLRSKGIWGRVRGAISLNLLATREKLLVIKWLDLGDLDSPFTEIHLKFLLKSTLGFGHSSWG